MAADWVGSATANLSMVKTALPQMALKTARREPEVIVAKILVTDHGQATYAPYQTPGVYLVGSYKLQLDQEHPANSMAIDRKLLEILCCPVSKQALTVLSPEQLALINKQIATGSIATADDRVVTAPLNEGLITNNQQRIYRIDDDIPVMLEKESIPTDQFEGL